MNIFIVSDIKRVSKSFAPYGFNLAKWLELKEVDLVHTVDPRDVDGGYSVEADSQTYTPGEKLSKQELVQREIDQAKKDLYIMLSSEASRLNYPLKVNTVIEENSIDKKIGEMMDLFSESLFIACTEPDGFIFNSTEEMVESVKNTGATFLFVPPARKFQPLSKVVLPTCFDADTVSEMKILQTLVDGRAPLLDAVYVAVNKKHPNNQLQEEAWKKIACKFFDVSDIRIKILDGTDTADTLLNYAESVEADLLAITAHASEKSMDLFQAKTMEKIIKNTTTPVLIKYQA